MFELLNAKTFNDLIVEDPKNAEDIVRQYVDFIKLVHAAEASPGELPSARERYLEHLESIRTYLGETRFQRLKMLFEAIREENGIVHGDIQMKNVMMVEGEPMLIDMDTLCIGNPVFDFAGLYATYRMFCEDEPGNSMRFLGITDEMAEFIWDHIMSYYFDTDDREKLGALTDKVRLAAAVRFLFILAVSDLKNGELGETRIKHTLEHIDSLLGCVDSLAV